MAHLINTSKNAAREGGRGVDDGIGMDGIRLLASSCSRDTLFSCQSTFRLFLVRLRDAATCFVRTSHPSFIVDLTHCTSCRGVIVPLIRRLKLARLSHTLHILLTAWVRRVPPFHLLIENSRGGRKGGDVGNE